MRQDRLFFTCFIYVWIELNHKNVIFDLIPNLWNKMFESGQTKLKILMTETFYTFENKLFVPNPLDKYCLTIYFTTTEHKSNLFNYNIIVLISLCVFDLLVLKWNVKVAELSNKYKVGEPSCVKLLYLKHGPPG